MREKTNDSGPFKYFFLIFLKKLFVMVKWWEAVTCQSGNWIFCDLWVESGTNQPGFKPRPILTDTSINGELPFFWVSNPSKVKRLARRHGTLKPIGWRAINLILEFFFFFRIPNPNTNGQTKPLRGYGKRRCF